MQITFNKNKKDKKDMSEQAPKPQNPATLEAAQKLEDAVDFMNIAAPEEIDQLPMSHTLAVEASSVVVTGLRDETRRIDTEDALRRDDNGVSQSGVQYHANMIVDKDGHDVTEATPYILDVNRAAINPKTGKYETGVVKSLTGKRAERATEILARRAARKIGDKAMTIAQEKLEASGAPKRVA